MGDGAGRVGKGAACVAGELLQGAQAAALRSHVSRRCFATCGRFPGAPPPEASQAELSSRHSHAPSWRPTARGFTQAESSPRHGHAHMLMLRGDRNTSRKRTTCARQQGCVRGAPRIVPAPPHGFTQQSSAHAPSHAHGPMRPLCAVCVKQDARPRSSPHVRVAEHRVVEQLRLHIARLEVPALLLGEPGSGDRFSVATPIPRTTATEVMPWTRAHTVGGAPSH